METAEQTELDVLYPTERPRGANANVKLEELPELHVKVNRSFLRSIKMFGVIEPVALMDRGDDGYLILAGKRRIQAARMLKFDTIPARIFDADDVIAFAPSMAVQTNEERSSNHIENFEACCKLALKNISEADIATATGLTVPTVRRYLSLRSVNGEILHAFCQWKVKHSVICAIQKLPQDVQEHLISTLRLNGTITADEVRRVTPPEPVQTGVFDGDAIAEWTSDAYEQAKRLLVTAPAGVPPQAIVALNAIKHSLTGVQQAA